MKFSEYLGRVLVSKNISANRFCKKLVDTKISRTSFYEYLEGKSIPTFERAFVILQKLDISLETKELVEMLSESKLEYQPSGKLIGSFKIDYSDLNTDSETLKVRISQVSKGINDYIKKLIKKDLEENILGGGVNE